MSTSTFFRRAVLACAAIVCGISTIAWMPAWLGPSTELAFESTPMSATIVAQEDGGDVSSFDVDTVVANVQAFYESVEDFHADFAQEFTNLTLGDTMTSTGHVYFRTPGMMRWDYAEPTERYLIRDGESLWVYEPEQGQYYTQPMDETDLPTALRFLMGQGNLTEDFEVGLHGSTTDERVVLTLEPRVPSGQYTRLRFVVDPSTWQVVETVIYDPIGNQNRLVFSSPELNSGLPESGFQFAPPEGAHQIQSP